MELGVALPTSARYTSAESIVRIAQDLARVRTLDVDEVFLNDQASSTVEEAVQRLQEIQTAMQQ